MRVYMTNGTLPFLLKLAKKHSDITFFFMKNEQGVLAYYEGTKKKIFSSGRTYEALEQYGNVVMTGFVAMEHIPIQSDSKPVFEKQLPLLKEQMIKADGLISLRILKQRRKNHYVILSQWFSKKDYEIWKEKEEEITVKNPAYFLNRRFTTGYHVIDEEELQQYEEK